MDAKTVRVCMCKNTKKCLAFSLLSSLVEKKALSVETNFYDMQNDSSHISHISIMFRTVAITRAGYTTDSLDVCIFYTYLYRCV